MPAPDPFLLLAFPTCSALPLMGSAGLFAYGPAPGIELIPYFFALLAWVGMAFVAVLLSPITALLRRIRGTRVTAPVDKTKEQEIRREPLATPVLESPGEGTSARV